MTTIKVYMSYIISIIIVIVIALNFDTICKRLDDIFSPTRDVIIKDSNEYGKTESFIIVKKVDDFIPYSKNDLINIFYTVLNSGWDEFTFYCPDEYDDCLNDMASLSKDEHLLAEINNYIHPYNSYDTIKTYYDDTGKVSLVIDYLYSDEEIEKIDEEINGIIDEFYDEDLSNRDVIKLIHDYIINNTRYDTMREEYDESDYDSDRMTGLLFEHYSVCSGYADTMAVVLNKLEIPNFKVASENHVWNAVYIDNEWLHLDLTWDDPVSKDGKDILDHSWFLIDDDTLVELDKKEKEHIYDVDFYLEFSQ